jgi:hypothetical protein
MKKFKLLNNILGFACFVFAAVVYTMTMEKSGSFWDCGEFIPSAFKLEIAHPPGFPLFLMLGRILSLFSGADATKFGGSGSAHVAMWCNLLSALMASGTVMFTYWITTNLTSKYVFKDGEEYTTAQIITVIGAGLIAATCCCFLDSQWFSAVEYIVFTSSQCFLSFNIWAILKWYDDKSERADHWLVLIAYMTGVSIGAHLLALLGLPAVAVAIYYKKFKNTTVLGWVAAVAAGFFMIGLYMKYIISYTLSYFSSMDQFFVNTLNMPFNSGVVFGTLLVVAVIVVVLRYTHTATERDFYIAMGVSVFYVLIGFILDDGIMAKLVRLLFPLGLYLSRRYGYEVRRYFNIGVLSIAFSYIGYTSYLMVPIRAEANPPINMNRPTDPFTLKSYVDRDQYGARPLLFGPDYTINPSADITDYSKTDERWVKNAKTHKYDMDGYKQDYVYREEVKEFFPRMGFWQEEGKKAAYRAWLSPSFDVINRSTHEVAQSFPPSSQKQANEYANELNKKNGNEYYVKDHITWGDNIKFFFKYQVGFMYFRYFMWNFAGRQDDIQGTYGNTNGRWISGIPFIDNSHLFFTPDWPQDHLPQSALHNKARNKFYMIPLIIGLIGFIFTFFKDEKTFWFLAIFFFTTGLAQIIFQNEPPIEPRERDYATACSFAVFTIWIGFGVVAMSDELRRRLKMPEVPIAIAVVALCALAPFLMGSQGWDDHNRNARYTARDCAIDYLQSCAPNAILFTEGDNDTYPLWYLQEVEGVRTDIRVINLSLAGVDWYIDQLRFKMNDAEPLKLTFTSEQLQGGNRDVVRYKQAPGLAEGTAVELKKVMNFIGRDDDAAKVMLQSGEKENYLPTRHFFINVDSTAVKRLNMVDPADYDKVVSRIDWTIPNGTVMKNDLITLDIVANNLWDHPIYFAVSVPSEAYLGMEKYFQLEGLTYRIVPKVNPTGSPYSAPVRLDEMYDNMMHKFRFGGIKENKDVYIDENIQRMTVNIRGNLGRLAEAVLEKADREAATGDSAQAKEDRAKAAQVIDYSLDELPADRVPHSVFDYSYPEVYYRAGLKDKGHKLLLEMENKALDELNYYKVVYDYTLKEARDNDQAYYNQLQQGQFMERHEVREQLFIMQELNLTAKKYEDAEFAAKIEKDFKDYQMKFVQMPPQQQGKQGPGGPPPGM